MPQDSRKCTKCKQKIFFDLDNISGIVNFKNLFYHSDCFVEYCHGRAAESGSPVWQKYINNMSKFEDEAKKRINYRKSKNDLNNYLISHYDVQEIGDKRFWTVVTELEQGVYKKKKCNPVPTDILLDAWKWSQVRLDAINRKNKIARKGPSNDIERIPYDLAIIVKHIPDYLKAKAKREAEEADRIAREKERVKINYNNIYSAPVQTEGLDDISAMLDEF